MHLADWPSGRRSELDGVRANGVVAEVPRFPMVNVVIVTIVVKIITITIIIVIIVIVRGSGPFMGICGQHAGNLWTKCGKPREDVATRAHLKHRTPSPPTKSLDLRGFDSSRLLILRGGNSYVRRIG